MSRPGDRGARGRRSRAPRVATARLPYVKRVRVQLGPLWPYAVLIGIPAATFILPDLLGGHLLMTGDNTQQNYPLRVLVGSMVRQGQLPFWNQYIFSGTPLLAGFNAGAFYPLVGLFAVLPDRVAWIATEVILFSLIAVGMYLFLRALALSTMACLLAAATFSFSGVVLSQVNHVDMTEGVASLPFMLLAVLHIVRDGRWRWSIVLGLGFALVIFGGAPEAMLDEAFLVIAYAALSAGLDRLRWWRVLSRCGVGAALALALSAVQWLPGIAAISNSQRSGLGGGFAATGSYPPSYGLLSLVPYLYGGYGHLGEETFFSHYNLPEVGVYVGLLPIVALLSLWYPRWPTRLARRERLTWYVIGLLGLLLALGANTPLEHLFQSIPLYGHQRLQSRNLIDVSVAVCVLFAGWLDRRTDGGRHAVTFDRIVALVPLGVVLGLAGWAVADPRSLITSLTSGGGTPSEAHTVRQATLIALGFCLIAAVLVWLRPILRHRMWITTVSVFIVFDLGLVAGTGPLVVTPSNAVLAGRTPDERLVAAHLTSGGRFELYNPQAYADGLNRALNTGLPDANIVARLPSLGGYAAIVSGRYNSVTLTHDQGELNVTRLGAGEFTQLDLQEILTAPEYFLVPLQGEPSSLPGVRRASSVAGDDLVLPMGSRLATGAAYPQYPARRPELVEGQSSTWFFGRSLDPARAGLLLAPGATGSRIQFGKVAANGATRWGPTVTAATGATSVSGKLPSGSAVGLALRVESGRLPAHQADITVGAGLYELDGALSDAVRPGPWRQAGSADHFTLYVRTRPPTPLHVVAPGHPAPSIDVLSNRANGEIIRVRSSRPVVLVRDVAWDGGWHASVTTGGGPSLPLSVDRRGLVQQVRLPAGTDVVTFRYRPPHWLVASAITEGSTLLLAILLVDTVLRRRGRRRKARPAQQSQQ
jgi:hypothetical protein